MTAGTRGGMAKVTVELITITVELIRITVELILMTIEQNTTES